MRGFKETWGRQAVGYRQGELTENEAVATSVVISTGGPLFLVGAAMAVVDGLSLGQILLVAPVAALIGGFLISWSARMAAQTGAAGSWLLRPTYGRYGSLLVSMVRLSMLVLWAVVGLELAAGWAGETIPLDPLVWIGVIVVVGLALVGLGIVQVVKLIWRRAVFVASVLLLAVLAWRLAQAGGSLVLAAEGSFWTGVQRAVEICVVLVPFVQLVARRLHDDRDSVSSFGVSYAIPAALSLVAGALVAFRLGSLPFEIGGFESGVAAVALAAAWLIVTELDQVFANFAAIGSESAGIVRVGPAIGVGLVMIAVVAALAFAFAEPPIEWASLAVALYFPAAGLAAVDFLWVHRGHYVEADIYGETITGERLNLIGIACWLVAVALGQLLDPIGPSIWTGAIPAVMNRAGVLPWRLMLAIAAAIVYLVVSGWTKRRSASVYGLRGL